MLFRQSDVPQVTELAWILSTVTPMGLLERATPTRTRSRAGCPLRAGLFAYPVLMAADILIYDSDVVPVGHDQKQHVEVTRDIAVKINETYGEILKLPEPRIQAQTADRARPRRPEDEQELRQHDRYFRRRKGNAETDHEHRDRLHPGRSAEGSGRVVDLPALLVGRTDGGNGGDARGFRAAAPATAISRSSFSPGSGNSSRRCASGGRRFSRKPGYIDEVLARGAERANEVANEVMARVRSAVGLR